MGRRVRTSECVYSKYPFSNATRPREGTAHHRNITMGSDYDSTGKSKAFDAKRTWANLIAFFLIGLCIGIVVAERLYIHRVASGSGSGVQRQLTAQSGDVSVLQTAKVAVQNPLAVDFSKPARNDLEELLRKVCYCMGGIPSGISLQMIVAAQIAPKREVLVAVANKNTLWGGMLETFTTGFKKAGVSNHLVLALDDETKKWCDEHGINAYLLALQVHKSQEGTGACG